MNRMAKTAISIVLLLLGAAPVLALDDNWPRTIALDEGMITIYAPQIEALDKDLLYYRAALAYRPDIDAEPIFGAGWLKARVKIDESNGIVNPRRLELTQARFPDGTADVQAEIATALWSQSANWNLDFSIDELEAALDAAQAESLAAQKLKTAPPRIVYRDHPALLVSIDGDPVLREIENSPYQAVINTPFPLITDGDAFYLNAAKGVWYRANAATGPYRFDASPPKDIAQMVEEAEARAALETDPEDVTGREPISASNAPEIVVTTEPAELLVTDGPADFAPLVDELLVLQNSEDDVFMHVGHQKYYIVLAGRWYRADALDGPWEYQAADALPPAFAEIPDNSPQADSRVYVAGTPEAEEAVLDAHVPQTAAVQRGEVEFDVEYDGDPEFDRVDGTEDLRYARNTGATVLESDRTYYLLEDGVWYVASSPHGPWVVSDHRPGELESIEPRSPVYNTKYVYVYDSTPEVVYVGYTPGYLGSYVYRRTLVYGTGWRYRPWVSPYYYYPRHSTWGFHVGYSDWGGWSFGLSWYWPSFSLNYYYGGYWHHGRPWYNRYWGYWGPRGYRYRPYHYGHRRLHPRYAYRPYGRHYDAGYRRLIRHDTYAKRDSGRWNRNDDRRHDRYGRERNRNLYHDDRQRARIAQTRDARIQDRSPRRGEEQRFVENRGVHKSSANPVRPAELRTKARVRDINRAARREPLVADNRGEVRRASYSNNGPREMTRSDAHARPTPNAPRRTRDTTSRREADNLVSQRSAQQRKAREERTRPMARNEILARAATRDRDADDRVSQQSARHAKVRKSRTEPVSGNNIRAASGRREKARQRSDEPVTRDRLRTAATSPDKTRKNRAAPTARNDTRRRSNAVAHHNRDLVSKPQQRPPETPARRSNSPNPGRAQQNATLSRSTREKSESSRRKAAPARSASKQRVERGRNSDRRERN